MIVESNVKPIVMKTMLVACVIVFFCAFLLATPAKETKHVASSSTVPRPANSQDNSDQSGDEWPMFHGALNHTGTVPTTFPVNDLISSWNYTTSTGDYVESSPAVAGGRMYVGSIQGTVYCLNTTTGASIWNYTTLYGGLGVYSSPAVAGGCMYVGSDQGTVYCLNATTGTLNWSYTTGNSVYSSPAVSGGCVYVGSDDGKVYCLDATTGASLWNYTTLYPGYGVYSSPAVAGGRMYVGSNQGTVYCLNATTGALNWSYQTGSNVFSSPAVAGGRVYVGCYDGKVYCLDAITGALNWSYTTGNSVYSSPAVSGGCVYVGNDDGKVYCLDAITGWFTWSYTTGGVVDSSPAVAGGRVYVGSWDNNTYCLDATTGSLVWSYTTGGEVDSSPAVAGGRVYVGSFDGNIYCIPIIPTAPRNFHVISDNAQSVLDWQVPANNAMIPVTGYNIYRGLSPGSETHYLTIGNLTHYWDLNVTHGQSYYYQVSAITITAEGIKSPEVNVTIVPGAPGTPRNLEANYSFYQIVLSWQIPVNNGGSAIIGYKIYRGTVPGNMSFLVIIDNVTTYIDTSATYGQLYYYTVSAGNNFGEGMQSTEVSIRRYMWDVPYSPQDIHAISGNAQITLTWRPPVDNLSPPITNYSIYHHYTLYKTVGNVSMFVDTGLENGVNYQYTVRAVNIAGEGYPSDEVSAVPFTIPTSPQNLRATIVNGQITLTWQPPADMGGAGVTNYRIYCGTSSGSETFLIMTSNVTTYIDASSHMFGIMYYYNIRAVNDAGEGPRTTEASATIPNVTDVPLTTYELVLIVGVVIFGVVAVGIALTLHLRDKKHIARLSSDIQRITGKPLAKKGTSRYTNEPEQKDDLPATRGSPKPGDDDKMKTEST